VACVGTITPRARLAAGTVGGHTDTDTGAPAEQPPRSLARRTALVLVSTALDAIFLPHLAVTLLWLLNRNIDAEHRNCWLSNVALGASAVLFLVIA
jgi:hypothetical protein